MYVLGPDFRIPGYRFRVFHVAQNCFGPRRQIDAGSRKEKEERKGKKRKKKKKGEKESPIDFEKLENANLNSLPDMLDFMAHENFTNIHLYTANLTIDLERYKKIRLGVMIQPSNDKKEGILIHRVIKGGLAEKHGIKENDILIKVNNTEVNTLVDLQIQVNGSGKGKILFSIQRDGIQKDIQILNYTNLKK